jgi:hypothetical protein
MHMKEFEVLDGGKSVLVRATTRAGLVTASLQGLMDVSRPRTQEIDVQAERPFSISAADFGTLLSDLLSAATDSSGKFKEAYEDIHFTLITDKKAEGTFVGRPASGFGSPPKKPRGTLVVAKNEAGEWETKIPLG